MEELAILALVALITILVTAGAVLLLYFWARRLHPTLRITLAALVGACMLLFPIWADGAELMIYFAVVAGAGILSFPTAYLATRKLEWMKENTASVFE